MKIVIHHNILQGASSWSQYDKEMAAELVGNGNFGSSLSLSPMADTIVVMHLPMDLDLPE